MINFCKSIEHVECYTKSLITVYFRNQNDSLKSTCITMLNGKPLDLDVVEFEESMAYLFYATVFSKSQWQQIYATWRVKNDIE